MKKTCRAIRARRMAMRAQEIGRLKKITGLP
jgi:hypothetical protein